MIDSPSRFLRPTIKAALVCLLCLIALGACSVATQTESNRISPTDTETAVGEADLSDPVYSDLAYLKQLGLMRGHLRVGYSLYLDGHLDAAKTHMKHPGSELYADLVPAFKARGVDGFANQLSALAAAVENDRGDTAVERAYAALLDGISSSEAEVSVAMDAPAPRLQLAAGLLKVAAEEYAIGVVDGRLENAHEYQDAYGFTRTALAVAEGIHAENPTAIEAQQRAIELIDELSPAWPALVPPERVNFRADRIAAAAADIESLAGAID